MVPRMRQLPDPQRREKSAGADGEGEARDRPGLRHRTGGEITAPRGRQRLQRAPRPRAARRTGDPDGQPVAHRRGDQRRRRHLRRGGEPFRPQYPAQPRHRRVRPRQPGVRADEGAAVPHQRSRVDRVVPAGRGHLGALPAARRRDRAGVRVRRAEPGHRYRVHRGPDDPRDRAQGVRPGRHPAAVRHLQQEEHVRVVREDGVQASRRPRRGEQGAGVRAVAGMGGTDPDSGYCTAAKTAPRSRKFTREWGTRRCTRGDTPAEGVRDLLRKRLFTLP